MGRAAFSVSIAAEEQAELESEPSQVDEAEADGEEEPCAQQEDRGLWSPYYVCQKPDGPVDQVDFLSPAALSFFRRAISFRTGLCRTMK
jgi:hypothetical protein